MQPICCTNGTLCVPKDKAITKFIPQNSTDHSYQGHFQAILFDTYMLPKLYMKLHDFAIAEQGTQCHDKPVNFWRAAAKEPVTCSISRREGLEQGSMPTVYSILTPLTLITTGWSFAAYLQKAGHDLELLQTCCPSLTGHRLGCTEPFLLKTGDALGRRAGKEIQASDRA
ncbi:hypothetical protein GH733_007071 [Mirounga leonina]|nr:hypothetical protein GH733_007071 [Mirounga leonina]